MIWCVVHVAMSVYIYVHVCFSRHWVVSLIFLHFILFVGLVFILFFCFCLFV